MSGEKVGVGEGVGTEELGVGQAPWRMQEQGWRRAQGKGSQRVGRPLSGAVPLSPEGAVEGRQTKGTRLAWGWQTAALRVW